MCSKAAKQNRKMTKEKRYGREIIYKNGNHYYTSIVHIQFKLCCAGEQRDEKEKALEKNWKEYYYSLAHIQFDMTRTWCHTEKSL